MYLIVIFFKKGVKRVIILKDILSYMKLFLRKGLFCGFFFGVLNCVFVVVFNFEIFIDYGV